MRKRYSSIRVASVIVAVMGLFVLAVLGRVLLTNSARQLATAIENDDVSAVRRWASRISNLSRLRLPGGLCPLSFAIKEGKPDSFLTLLEGGIDPNTRNRDGTAPIHHASAADSSVFIEYLLSHGADPDLQVDGRHPCEHPLSWAIYTGRVDNAILLIKHGADVDSVDSYGRNMLLQAWGAAEFEIVYQLLQHGADVNAPGKQDFTFIQHVRYASPSFYRNLPGRKEYWCEAVLDWLSARGIDVKTATWKGDRWIF